MVDLRVWLSAVVEVLTKPYGELMGSLLVWMLLIGPADVPGALAGSPIPTAAVAVLLLPCSWIVALLIGTLVGQYEYRRLCSRPPTRIEDADPYESGVAFSRLAERSAKRKPRGYPEYAPRDEDEELRRLLRESNNRLILLIGPPASGKTRTAFEATRDTLPDYELLQPMLTKRAGGNSDDGKTSPGISALEDVLGVGTPRLTRWSIAGPLHRAGKVLWLDNLGDYLKGGHVPAAELDRWLAVRHSVAVATITSDDYDEFMKDAAYGNDTRRIVKRAEAVFLQAQLSPAEQARAAALYDVEPGDLEFLPEYFVAAKEHLRQLREMQAQGGAARSLVEAAVAWRRAGLPLPIPRDFLERAVRYERGQVTEGAVTAALEWASDPVGEALALLNPHGDGYDVSDFVVAQVEKDQGGKLSEIAVEFMGEYLADDPEALLTVVRTLTRRRQGDDAETIARAIKGEPYESSAQTEINSHRTIERFPALGMQLWRVRGRALREPGAVDVAPTPEQQRASRDELEGRVPTEPWQAELFSSELPEPDSGRYVRFYRRLLLRRFLQVLTLVLSDALAVFVGIVTVMTTMAMFGDGFGAGDVEDALRFAAVACAITPLAVWWAGLYEADAERARLLLIVTSLTAAALASAFCVALLDEMSFNSGATVWISFSVAVLVCWGLRHRYDIVSRNWVERNRLAPRVLLLGPRAAVADRGPTLVRSSKRPMFMVGYLSESSFHGDPFCLGDYGDLVAVIRRHYIQRCVILDERMPVTRTRALADDCHGENVAVESLVGTEEILLGMWSKTGAEFPLLELKPLALSPGARILKRTFDLAVLFVLAVVLVPALGILWVVVKAESPREPAWLRAKRTGRGEKSFKMRRFRTRKRKGPVPTGGRPIELHPPGRIGQLIETLGLDELPQAWNVIVGDMSIVGPRPFASDDIEQEDADFRRRYIVRPGITGFWQLSRRGTSERDLIEMDLFYLRFWSIFQDLALVLRTFIVVFRGVPRNVRRGSTAPEHTGAPRTGDAADVATFPPTLE